MTEANMDDLDSEAFLEYLEAAASPWLKEFPEGKDSDFQKIFDDLSEELRRTIVQYEPLTLLTNLAYENLFQNADNVSDEPPIRNLEQHHIELLQAYIATNTNGWWKSCPKILPTDQVENCLKKMLSAYTLRRMQTAEKQHDKKAMLVSSMQLQTLAIRNPAYPDHMFNFLKEFYTPIDAEIRSSTGVSAIKLAQMLQNLVKTTESKASDSINEKLIPILRIQKFEEIGKAFPQDVELQAQVIEMASYAKRKKWTLKQTQENYHEWWKFKLHECFELSLADFKSAYGSDISSQKLQEVIDIWSLEIGKLAPTKFEYLILDNPVWKKPFLKIGDGKYFLPIANLLISNAFLLIQAVVSRSKVNFLKRRKGYLEDKLESLFAKSFQSAEILPNVKWQDEVNQGEHDLVILLPPYALIAEAKSGAIDEKGKRGAVSGLSESVAKLIGEPANQSQGFIDWALRHKSKQQVDTKYGERMIDCSQYNQFIQLNVILENFSPHAHNWQAMANAEVVDAAMRPVPTVTITDLECVLEILDTQSELLHYWMRRQEVEAIALDNDELGWLRLYLDNRMYFKPSPIFLQMPMLLYLGQSFNSYFLRSESYEPVPKPISALPPEIKQLIALAESARFNGWIDFTMTLLDMHNFQLFELSKLIQDVSSGKGCRDYDGVSWDCSLVEGDNKAIAFCVFRTDNVNIVNEISEQLFDAHPKIAEIAAILVYDKKIVLQHIGRQ